MKRWNYKRPITDSERLARKTQRDCERLEGNIARQERERKEPGYEGPKYREKSHHQ
jgi:hypothetical protein